MKKTIYVAVVILISLFSFPIYKLFTDNFKIELTSKKQIVDIPSPAPTFDSIPLPTSTPTPLPPQIIYKVPNPTPTPTPTIEPTPPPTQQQQTSQLSLETACKAATNLLKTGIIDKIGNTPYYASSSFPAYLEAEMARYYVYCLAHPNNLSDYQITPWQP